MEKTEYTLTSDEKEMVDDMAAAHQSAYQAELNTVLGAIIRHRKLGAGNWNLADGKLTKA